MTERNEHVDAAAEKLTDGETVERLTHPTPGASEPDGEAAEERDGEAAEERDDQTPRTPEQ